MLVCKQFLPLVPRVDFESAEAHPQLFEGPLPSLWPPLLFWQDLGLILTLETGFWRGYFLTGHSQSFCLKRKAATQKCGFLTTILGSGHRNIGSRAFFQPRMVRQP